MGASIPESRGVPSRRRVAITACRWLPNLSCTKAARPGSACWTSDHVTAIAIPADTPTQAVSRNRSDEGQVLIDLGAGHLMVVVEELLPLDRCEVAAVRPVGRHPQAGAQHFVAN